MVTTGGEIAFITRMIEESLHLRERVIWYTTMLGKLSSVSVLIETLLEHKNNNYAVTEFVQGNKTRRWAIAWSWTDLRPTVVRSIPLYPIPPNIKPNNHLVHSPRHHRHPQTPPPLPLRIHLHHTVRVHRRNQQQNRHRTLRPACPMALAQEPRHRSGIRHAERVVSTGASQDAEPGCDG